MIQQLLQVVWAFIVWAWPGFMAVGIPFIVNFFASSEVGNNVKTIMAAMLSLAVGILAGFVALGVHPTWPTASTFGVFSLAIFGGSTIAYRAFKSVGITNRWLDALLAFGSVVQSGTRRG
jgi:hypothetical protein